MTNANPISALFGFNSAFTITHRDTGEVLVDATKEDADAIEALIASDRMKEGANAIFDRVANIASDVCCREYQIDIDADDPATIYALFERFSAPLELSYKMGVMDVDALRNAVVWSSKASGLPKVDTIEVSVSAVPVIRLYQTFEQANAENAAFSAQNAPSTKTLQ